MVESEAWLRKVGVRTSAALDVAITSAFEAVPSSDAEGWFQQCAYCIEPK